MYIYYMPDTPVGMFGQLPNYSIFGTFVCFLVAIYVFSTIQVFLINLVLATCTLRYVLLLDVLIDISYVSFCI